MNEPFALRAHGSTPPLGASESSADQAEVTALRAHAEALAEGQGALAMWFGPRGSGKTRLLHQAASIATEAVPHVRTLHVPGDSLRSSSLAGVAGMLVHALDLPSTPDTELVDDVLRSGEVRRISDPEMLRASANIARVATASRPILVLIDDLPYFAVEDISALAMLAARIAELPLLIMATSSFPLPPDKSLSAFGPLWMRRIAPIGASEAWNIARTYGAGFVPPVIAERIAELGGGLPADVVEIVRSLSPAELRGLVPLPETVSLSTPTISEARAWLASLDPPHRQLIIGAALTPFGNRDHLEETFGVAMEGAGMSEQDRWFTADQETFAWAERRRRTAVLAIAPRREVLAAHRAMAEHATEGSAERAWNLLRAGSVLEDADLADLVRAARENVATGDLELAITLAHEALKVATDRDVRADLSCTLGIAALHLGHLETAYEELNACLTVTSDPVLTTLAVVGIILTVVARDGSLPTTVIDVVVEQLREEHPDLAIHVLALAARAGFRSSAPRGTSADESLEWNIDSKHLAVPEHYLALGDEIATTAAGVGENARFGLHFSHVYHGEGTPTQARHLTDPLSGDYDRFDLVAWDRAVAKVEVLRARRLVEEATLAASDVAVRLQRTDSPYFASRVASTEIQAQFEQGNIQVASRIAQDVMFSLPMHLSGPGYGIVQIATIFTLAGLRPLADQWASASRLASHTYSGPLLRAYLPRLLCIRADIAGDEQTASEQAANCAQHLADLGAPPWHSAFIRRAELLFLVGRDQAGSPQLALIEEAVAATPEPTTEQRANRAVARALMRPPEEVLARVVEAAAEISRVNSPYTRAQNYLTLIRALHRIGKDQYQVQARAIDDAVVRDRATYLGMLVSLGATAAEEAGAVALVPVIRRVLGAASATPRPAARGYTNTTYGNGDGSGEDLTAEERIVAQMVAAGATNKQVAAALFVSVRTIELRLTSIYRKLGLNSRKELPRAMAALEASAPPSPRTARSPEAFNAAFE